MKRFFIIMLVTLSFIQVQTASANSGEIRIISEAAILVDSQSGTVLYEKNGYERMYPASLTKIATAIYALEKGEAGEKVTVGKNAVNVEGTKVYLNEGEEVTLKKLIQGMLINSGNDAAVAIAEHLDGSVAAFSEQINLFLKKEIGVEDTHFTNPHGLYDENHYTTANDLAKITNYALKNPIFSEIFGTIELPWDGESWDTTIYTHHRLLKGEIPFDGITGGKTGFVNQSKQTLATTAENENIKLTAIVLKADYKRDIYKDTTGLLNLGFLNYKTTTISKDSLYQVGDKEYVVAKDTYVTEDLSGSSRIISEKGMLQIQNKNKEIIQEIPLTAVVKKEEPVQKEENAKEIKHFSISSIFLYILFILVASVLTVKRKVFFK